MLHAAPPTIRPSPRPLSPQVRAAGGRVGVGGAGPLARRPTRSVRSVSPDQQPAPTPRLHSCCLCSSTPANTFLSLGNFFFIYYSKRNQSSVFFHLTLSGFTELLHPARMSALSVNDHLEGILSDFEGMSAVILNHFTADCFVGAIKPNVGLQLQAVCSKRIQHV